MTLRTSDHWPFGQVNCPRTKLISNDRDANSGVYPATFSDRKNTWRQTRGNNGIFKTKIHKVIIGSVVTETMPTRVFFPSRYLSVIFVYTLRVKRLLLHLRPTDQLRSAKMRRCSINDYLLTYLSRTGKIPEQDTAVHFWHRTTCDRWQFLNKNSQKNYSVKCSFYFQYLFLGAYNVLRAPLLNCRGSEKKK